MLIKIKQIVARWVNEGNELSNTNGPAQGMLSNRKVSHSDMVMPDNGGSEFKNPMNITLYNAIGGRIVKFYRYDRETDRGEETTYIIPDDLDFEKELGKCITMEALKHTI